jgi:hypothetical protein
MRHVRLNLSATVDSLKAAMESMANQFKGFQEMMATSLDKQSALEAWRVTADESMGTLLKRSTETMMQMDETAARIKSLEFRPPPPPLPPPPPIQWQLPHPPPLPQPTAEGIDLNVTRFVQYDATTC